MMFEAFEIKQRKNKKYCDAKKCKHNFYVQAQSCKLCENHWGMLTEEEQTKLQEIEGGVFEKTILTKSPEEKALAIAEPEKDEASEMSNQLSSVVIIDQSMLDMLGQVLTDVKVRIKTLESHRVEFTKPLLDAKKKLDSMFKPAIKALEKCESIIKDKMQDYIVLQETRRLEAMKEGNHETAISIAPAELPANMSQTKRWVFEVSNFDLVPRDFLIVDEKSIKELIAEIGGENVNIPGIKVEQKTSIRVGTK